MVPELEKSKSSKKSRKSRKKMLLIFNPRSGMQNFPTLFFKVVDKFTEAGFLVTAYPTQAPGEVKQLVANYAGGYDYLVCSGGDGTIGEAIGALLNLEKRPAFGLIPAGTVNDFAQSLGIPNDILTAVDIIINSAPNALDIGRFGDRHFSYVAAFGMFTDVSYATPQNTKNLLGKLAYFLEGVKRVGSIKSSRCEFTLDGEVVSGNFVLGIVGNGRSIASIRLPAEMGVQMDDGLFEVILIQLPKTLKDHQEIISSLFTQELFTQEIRTHLLTIRKAKKIKFTSDEPIAWTLDGDFGGEYTEVNIENIRHALEVITPGSGV